jgi:hypothetical protein
MRKQLFRNEQLMFDLIIENLKKTKFIVQVHLLR